MSWAPPAPTASIESVRPLGLNRLLVTFAGDTFDPAQGEVWSAKNPNNYTLAVAVINEAGHPAYHTVEDAWVPNVASVEMDYETDPRSAVLVLDSALPDDQLFMLQISYTLCRAVS